MASSDYAHLILKDGEEIAVNDWKLEPYKNWLYLHNEKAWDKSVRFSKPVIAHIPGDVELDIGPFAIISKHIHETAQHGCANMYYITAHNADYSGMQTWATLQCYGWKDTLTKNAIRSLLKNLELPTDYEGYHSFSSNISIKTYSKDMKNPLYVAPGVIEQNTDTVQGISVVYPEGHKKRIVDIHMGKDWENAEWVGVNKPLLSKFKKWLTEQNADYADSIKWDSLLTVNPGDAIIAQGLGIETPTNKVGESSEPLLIQALKNPKKS